MSRTLAEIESTKPKENRMTNAETVANYVHRLLTHIHRDVYRCDKQIILYGNDAFRNDPRSQREVELIRASLSAYGITEYEFGLSDDGLTWAILAEDCPDEAVDIDELHNELWSCWFAACEESAAGRLRRHGDDLPGQMWLWDEDGSTGKR